MKISWDYLFEWKELRCVAICGMLWSAGESPLSRSSDEGVYYCRAENSVGTVAGTLSLTVHGKSYWSSTFYAPYLSMCGRGMTSSDTWYIPSHKNRYRIDSCVRLVEHFVDLICQTSFYGLTRPRHFSPKVEFREKLSKNLQVHHVRLAGFPRIDSG